MTANLEQILKKLLNEVGSPPHSNIAPIDYGGNNRVFRVTTPQRTLLLKQYFKHPSDPRHRAHTEFTFSEYAWQKGVRNLAQPIAIDDSSEFALYEFIEGTRLRSEEIDRNAIDCVLDFFFALNTERNTTTAQQLPIASDAHFSLQGLLNSVRQRLDRLNEFAPKSEIDTDAKSFAEEALEPAWNNATAELGDSAMAEGRDLSQKLPQEQRCLSPSDFGFHNALRDLNGGLCFLDFEYAGWDDPAKMVCDFFLHPGVPVPQSFFAHFYSKVTAFFSADSDLSQRIRLTYPLHRIKWCCIVLNEFLKLESERREFAGAGTDHEQVKATQLAKAKYTLARSAP